MREKLVRDKIPEYLEGKGFDVTFDVLPPDGREQALWGKLDEELKELKEEKNLEEIADVIQVLLSLGKQRGFTESEILNEVQRKRAERGAFEEGIILKDITER